MHAWYGRLAQLRCDSELNSQLSCLGAIIGAALLKIERADKPERPQRRVVKSPAALQVLHAQRNVIQHLASLILLEFELVHASSETVESYRATEGDFCIIVTSGRRSFVVNLISRC
jgi:hypothetical protein